MSLLKLTAVSLLVFEDSGAGFDCDLSHQDLSKNNDYIGRGERLIRKLCDEYAHSGKGNIAHSAYIWSVTS